MTKSAFNSCGTRIPNPLWNAPARVLHWLVAISLSGATYLTAHGETGHAILGWIALGGLLMQLPGKGNNPATGVVLWLLTAGAVALNLSGLLAAQSTFHLGATLVVLVMAAFYCATVLFELLQRVTVSPLD